MSNTTVEPPVVNPAAAHSFLYGAYLGSACWALRRFVASVSGDGKAFDKIINITTPGLGQGSITASVCLPKSKTPIGGRLPCVVVLEGGGFILGEPNDGQDMCREMADKSGAIILSLDYAKAPRYPFPHALLQGYEVLQWLGTDQSQQVLSAEIDTSRVALLGKSAGGNLVAALSLLVSFPAGPCASFRRDLGPDFRLRAQLLLYPSTSNNELYRVRYAGTDEAARTRSLPIWMAELMESAYLPPGIDVDQIFVAPNLTTPTLLKELAPQLAPCALFIAGLDCLKDEARAYAGLLRDAGIETEVLDYPLAIHGFPHYKPGQPDYREEDIKSCRASVVRILCERFRQ
ncbi:alpha/beta hydrolase fold-domain-containing protein [Microdochium trichocladiopsis]|uniref:Alpha/beta hydrolase fold-domain-containing protein n=1 Tax=Microdochium trichocladiopsis TaxID=1682393 RepID=A0A9P8XUK5_9PEZI|nr:alpha/beta hydrolase fold-domain-containing protein [Microdochium trichocladiopsis]KAH7020716.1 alpha/beta hydrolase fold-domain-containing protein [Microdochium trichocladiopsis]